MWLATRDGIGGHLIDLETGSKVWTADRLQDLASQLMPTATSLGCDRELLGIGRLVLDGGGAARQRGIVRRRGLDVAAADARRGDEQPDRGGGRGRACWARSLRRQRRSGAKLRGVTLRRGSRSRRSSPLRSARRFSLVSASLARAGRAPRAGHDQRDAHATTRSSCRRRRRRSARSPSPSRTPARRTTASRSPARRRAVIKPGKSAKLVVTFTKAGPFAYTSTVAGDAKKGMKGMFTAKAAAPPTGERRGRQGALRRRRVRRLPRAEGRGHGRDDRPEPRPLDGLARDDVIAGHERQGRDAALRRDAQAKQIQDVADFVFESRAGERGAGASRYIPSRSSIVSLRRHFGAALTWSWR